MWGGADEGCDHRIITYRRVADIRSQGSVGVGDCASAARRAPDALREVSESASVNCSSLHVESSSCRFEGARVNGKGSFGARGRR